MNTKLQELKDLIKAKAEYQKKLKMNRKTVHFTGERLMSPSQATEELGGTYRPNGDSYYYFGNPGTKHDLRLLYAAYGLLRGKSFSQTESHYPEENHPLNKYKSEIMSIVEEYSDEETVCTD